MTHSQPPSVELYVRSLASRAGHTERVIESLERLEREDAVASVRVTVWGEEVGLSTTAVETPTGQSILDTVSKLRAWADSRDASLEPFFQHRETHSTITGETYASLQLPAAMMVERVSDRVSYVTPHERHGAVQTVDDRVAALATGSEDGPEKRTVSP